MKEVWSGEAGKKFGENTKKLKVGKRGIDDDFEELLKKIKDRIITKKRGRE